MRQWVGLQVLGWMFSMGDRDSTHDDGAKNGNVVGTGGYYVHSVLYSVNDGAASAPSDM